jgi:hypothetical protein
MVPMTQSSHDDKNDSPERDDHARRLQAIGWRAPAVPLQVPHDRQLARVIAQHRNGYRVHDGLSEFARCSAAPRPASAISGRSSPPTSIACSC